MNPEFTRRRLLEGAGVVAVGATDTGIVYEGAFGKRDAAHGPAMTLDTVFWLLSMTKAVTATACMQLVEQGRLQLDEPVGRLLPELASPRVLEGFDASGAPRLPPARRPITLRHLMTHTSGLTCSNWSDKLPRYEKFTGQPDIAESKDGALAAPLEFDPGERRQRRRPVSRHAAESASPAPCSRRCCLSTIRRWSSSLAASSEACTTA